MEEKTEKQIEKKDINICDEWKIYLYMLRCAIYGTHLEPEKLADFQKVAVAQLADRANRNGQRVLLSRYLLEYAQYIGEEWEEPSGYKTFIILKEYDKYKCLRDLMELSREQGLHFVIFKGCVLANLYPQYAERTSCDSDIYIEKEEQEQALRLLYTYGYEKNEEHSKGEVTVLMHKKRDYTGKRLSILDRFELTKENKRITLNTCGFDVTTLGYQEHLIYQLFHIIKHFSLQGVGMKYLADITLYVNAYGQYIDYSDFWEKVERLGYDKFCYEFFNLCVELLGMKDDILQGRKAEKNSGKMLLMQDLFQMGKTYADKTAGWQIMGMMTPYFVGEKEGSQSAGKRKLQVIFPSSRDLPEEYLYAKKHPVLLPIAWGHKAVRYLVRYQKNRKTWYSVSEKLDVAQKRIALMDSLGLLDKR